MNSTTPHDAVRPRIGISLCLLGEEVRHDGGHKRDRFVMGVLDEYFEWVPMCPEMDVGMGVPREPIRLVVDEELPRLVGVKSGRDWTDEMSSYADVKVDEIGDRIDGFILKKGSPSCGMARVKVYDNNGVPGHDGVGAFARVLLGRLPNLPVEEEGRLNDPGLRENFIARVYAYRRWRDLLTEGLTPGRLVAFHTAHKLLLMAHSPKQYYELGRMVAEAGTRPLDELGPAYEDLFMTALARPASKARQVNTLQHLCGFLKDHLDAGGRAELVDVIDQYRRGNVPIVVPLTLLKHHLRAIDHPWVEQQVYLSPYPRELGLRSHV